MAKVVHAFPPPFLKEFREKFRAIQLSGKGLATIYEKDSGKIMAKFPKVSEKNREKPL